MAGLVPRTTSAENKLMWGLTYPRLLGFVFTLVISTNVNTYFVHTYLQPLYILSNIGFYFLLTRKDVTNPNKVLAQGLLSYALSATEPKKYLSIIGAAYLKAHPYTDTGSSGSRKELDTHENEKS